MKIVYVKKENPFTLEDIRSGECFRIVNKPKEIGLTTDTIFMKTDCTDYDLNPALKLNKGISSYLCIDVKSGNLAKFPKCEEIKQVETEMHVI